MANKPEVLLESIANLGEGPVWDGEKNLLYFVDIDGCKLNIYNPKTGENNQIATPGRIGMMSLCNSADKLICAIEKKIYLYDFDKFTPLIMEDIFTDANRFNDGKCDKAGRLYVGSLDFTGEKKAELYVISTKMTKIAEEDKLLRSIFGENAKEIVVESREKNIAISNGIAFSNDGKYMYYIDTPSGFLWRYDYDEATGNIENRTAIIDYRDEKGGFDGMTIDSEGALWVASWGGFSVTRYDPVNGKKLDVVELPAPNVTSCEFGGDDLTTLYITTAGGADSKLKEKYPLSGSLFVVETDVKGVECNKFAI